jgi:hypothetical protein
MNTGSVTLCVSGIPIIAEIDVMDQVSQVNRIDEELVVQPKEGDNIKMIWRRGYLFPDECVDHPIELNYIEDEKDGDIAQRSVRYRGRGNVITFEF